MVEWLSSKWKWSFEVIFTHFFPKSADFSQNRISAVLKKIVSKVTEIWHTGSILVEKKIPPKKFCFFLQNQLILANFEKRAFLLNMAKNPSGKWVKDPVFGMWQGKPIYFHMDFSNFTPIPKNQLIWAIFKNCRFCLKWPKTLLENGLKT